MKKVSIYFNDKLHVTVVTRMKKNLEKIRNNGKGNNIGDNQNYNEILH